MCESARIVSAYRSRKDSDGGRSRAHLARDLFKTVASQSLIVKIKGREGAGEGSKQIA